MILPTIHLNGTSREALLAELERASSALRHALDALVQASPNARDYYPQGPAAFTQAISEHEARCAKVRAVKDEIEAIAQTLWGCRNRGV